MGAKQVLRLFVKMVTFPLFVIYIALMLLVGSIHLFFAWLYDDNHTKSNSDYNLHLSVMNDFKMEFKNFFTKI